MVLRTGMTTLVACVVVGCSGMPGTRVPVDVIRVVYPDQKPGGGHLICFRPTSSLKTAADTIGVEIERIGKASYQATEKLDKILTLTDKQQDALFNTWLICEAKGRGAINDTQYSTLTLGLLDGTVVARRIDSADTLVTPQVGTGILRGTGGPDPHYNAWSVTKDVHQPGAMAYGPYVTGVDIGGRGRYRVGLRFEWDEQSKEVEVAYAEVITTNREADPLARVPIMAKEGRKLSDEALFIEFNVSDGELRRKLEFRVFWHGKVSLKMSNRVELKRIGDI